MCIVQKAIRFLDDLIELQVNFEVRNCCEYPVKIQLGILRLFASVNIHHSGAWCIIKATSEIFCFIASKDSSDILAAYIGLLTYTK